MFFSKKNTSEINKATSELCKLTCEKLDRIVENNILTTEFPGYEYLTQFLDGCITYFLSFSPLYLVQNPVLYVGRFYFPECKFFELDYRKKDTDRKITFWNGNGRFYSSTCPGYKGKFYEILYKYKEIFNPKDCEPLYPSLKDGIYINRFTNKDETIFTIYNGTGYSYYGDILEIEITNSKVRIYNLINERECEIEKTGKKIKMLIEKK